MASASLRAARLQWRARIAWSRWRGTGRAADMSTRVGFYRGLWDDAARAVGATVTELAPGIWRVDRAGARTLIHNYIVQIDDPVILNIAGDKALCHRLLMQEGLPVPAHEVYTLGELEKAERFMARHPGAIFVIKPADGTSGARGVTTHVETAAECRTASALASLYGARILIERWVPGESYRLLFLDGELIHASRRRGDRITGDGTATIAQLIARRGGDASPEIEREIAATLAAQGLAASAVLEAGREVVIRSTGTGTTRTVQTRTVFDEQATAQIGPELREQARRAVVAIGSAFAGVDIITADPAVALERAGGAINEINTTPGLHHHYGLAGLHDGPPPAVRVLARLLTGTGVPGGARAFTGQL